MARPGRPRHAGAATSGRRRSTRPGDPTAQRAAGTPTRGPPRAPGRARPVPTGRLHATGRPRDRRRPRRGGPRTAVTRVASRCGRRRPSAGHRCAGRPGAAGRWAPRPPAAGSTGDPRCGAGRASRRRGAAWARPVDRRRVPAGARRADAHHRVRARWRARRRRRHGAGGTARTRWPVCPGRSRDLRVAGTPVGDRGQRAPARWRTGPARWRTGPARSRTGPARSGWGPTGSTVPSGGGPAPVPAGAPAHPVPAHRWRPGRRSGRGPSRRAPDRSTWHHGAGPGHPTDPAPSTRHPDAAPGRQGDPAPSMTDPGPSRTHPDAEPGHPTDPAPARTDPDRWTRRRGAGARPRGRRRPRHHDRSGRAPGPWPTGRDRWRGLSQAHRRPGRALPAGTCPAAGPVGPSAGWVPPAGPRARAPRRAGWAGGSRWAARARTARPRPRARGTWRRAGRAAAGQPGPRPAGRTPGAPGTVADRRAA